VIDLRLPDEHSTAFEKRMVEAAGMRYVNVPMNGFATPLDAKVSEVLALLDSTANGPVFVHCRRGSDRTGTVIACYRVTHDGWPNEKAKQEAESLGMRWFEIGMKHYIMNFKPASERLAQGAGTRSSGDQ
jgi:protein tyrosine/serine phosphatase